MKELYPELIEYIFDYCIEYFSDQEKEARNYYLETQKTIELHKPFTKLIKVKEWHMKDDKSSLDLLKEGYKKFKINTATRIYNEHKNELKLNLCPNCKKIARTPNAKQCRFCSNNWH
jgi:hypothetical protein